MKCPVIYDANTKIWSNPIKNMPRKMCLGQKILEKLDQNDPNKIIEVNYDNGEKLTSGQLKTLVITAAHNLLNLGIKKGDVVLFFNSLNSLTTPIVFACYIIGAVICPIELLFGDDDADYVINKLNPTVILYDPIFKNRIVSTIKRISLPNLKYLLSFESSYDGKSVPQMLCSPVKSTNDFVAPDLGDPDILVAALLLTSGTTGRPKLTCLSHSLLLFDVNTYWKTAHNSVIYVPTAFRWIVPVIFMMLPILSDFSRVFSGQIATPELCLDLMRKHKVTHFLAVDGLVVKIFQYAEKQQYGDYLKTLQNVVTSGERISKRSYELVKSLAPNSIFIRGYGMTELGGCIATSAAYESTMYNIECAIGYLAEGISVKIIDENKKSLGPNQNGQICIKSVLPHLKYYKNDKANAESYTNDGEWFLTGDYGKYDDEYFLHAFNRCKDLIKCRQRIVIPSILETHLEQHPAIESNYVIGIPDSSKLEIPVSFIKLNANASNWKTHEELKNDIEMYLKSVLLSDQLPPEKIYFLENLPYTLCGKVDKIGLKQLAKQNLTN